MVKKENRLTKRKSFNYLFSKGKVQGSNLTTLIYLPSNQKKFKIGYSVSKKVGNSVVRHKKKRQLKEAFLKISNNVLQNAQYIIVAKPEIKDKTFDEICKNVEYIFKKAGIMKNDNE